MYESTKPILPTLDKAQTEKVFIQPTLDLLGYANRYMTQPPTETGTPDYLLFPKNVGKQ
ncbi:MAG TPA: hypothetical protein G4N93_05530 [Dehalococcoidia bacterium]|nr:hypothetical protein [Dehalococcoidia bacterium]